MAKKRVGRYAKDKFCTECGRSHAPRDRQKNIRRMVVNDVSARDIKTSWSCYYPHRFTSDASDRMLFRDIRAVKEQEGA